MSDPRSILKNRKTNESWKVNSPTSLSKISKQNVFTKTGNEIDYSKYDSLIENCMSILPEDLPSIIRLSMARELRKFIGNNPDKANQLIALSKELMNQTEVWLKLIEENGLNIQATQLQIEDNKSESSKNTVAKNKNDEPSLASFLAFIGKSFIGAQLNSMIPGATIFLTVLGAAAAQGDYQYHQGKPDGGIDLCEGLLNCIQGYLTEIGAPFNNATNPQISSTVAENTTAEFQHCLNSQTTLGNALINAFRGKNDFSTNCTFTTDTDVGGKLLINATNIDPIACDTLKAGTRNVLQNCPTPSTTGSANLPPASNANLYLYGSLGVIGGVLLLGILAMSIKHCRDYRREVNHENVDFIRRSIF